MAVIPPWLQKAHLPTSHLPVGHIPKKATAPPKDLEIVPLMDKDISPQDKMRCEEFARQYIIDFNQRRAAMRMGYGESVAARYGGEFFWRPYTQAYLVSLIRNIEERCLVCRNEVLAGLLREANRYDEDATSSSRIAAWREIGRILGMYINRIELSANSSGVMEVPLVKNSEQWEAIAADAQTELMRTIRQ